MSLSSEQPAVAELEALRELAAFPLVEALYGRRSRRFAVGAEIPDGPLAFRSRHEPLPRPGSSHTPLKAVAQLSV